MKHILLFFASLMLTTLLFGQHYYNTPAITPYGNPGGLNNDVEKPYGDGLPAGWTNIQPSTHPGWSSAVTLPFTFAFNSQNFTSVKVSTTGLVTFTANPSTPGGTHNVIPSSSVPDNTICVWGLGSGSGPQSNDRIVTKTFGSTPNRQFWIMWNSYNNESLTPKCYTYWSVVLEETSNKIYIVDQLSPTKGGCGPLLTLGLQYSSTSALMVTGSPNIGPLASNSSQTVDNRYYEFIPGQRPNYDMAIDYIQTNKYQTSSTPVEIRGIVKNFGLLTVNSYDINYQLDNGPVMTEHVTGASIAMYGDQWYFHDSIWMATGLGTHYLKVWADNINGNSDQNTWNDTMYKELEVMGIFVPKLSVHEYFNSSNHFDCHGAMDSLRTVFTVHPAEYTLISYQMDTDPYATPDGENRATFYGVDSLPDMYVNGINRMDPRFYSEVYFNDFKAPAYISVTPQISKSGNTITVTAALLPFPDWTNPPNAMKIRIALVELITTGNVGTNGDTKFYSVFRKFLPDVNGTNQAAFTPGLYVNINKSHTFTAGQVENINNMGVVVYIQNDVTGEIYQSGFAQINTGFDEKEAAQGITKIYPNPANEVVGVSFELAEAGEVSFEVYDLTGRKLYSAETKANQGLGTHWIDIKNLNNGVYFVKMQTQNHEYTQKFIVHK